jgi:phenylalanyl-tRNA synthetase beta chain
MPTVTLNKEVVEKMIGKKLSLEELKDRISMLGTDLEKIEGNEIVVEIFPNRPDMLSEAGFARALSSFIGVNTGLKEYKAKKGGPDYKIIIEKEVKEVRPFTACAIIKNLDFDDEKIREIIQLQEKLHVTFGRNRKKLAIGIYPLEKISLPITYTAKKPSEIKFRPLESDREMSGAEILKNHPTGKEYAHLLEGKKLYPVFIDAKGEILSLPPIINSHNTGRIDENTKEVFIECSGFDFSVLSKCLNIIVTSLADIGGEIYEMTLDFAGEKKKSPALSSEEWDVDLQYVNKIIGMNFKESEIKKLFEKMGYGFKNKKVLVPCYRADILHQMDLAEDIAIAYGYENFEPEIPNVSTVAKENPFEIFKDRVADILVGAGLIEVMSYHLNSEEINSKKMFLEEECVKLENSLTADRTILRSWLMPGIMQIFSENTNKEYPQSLFEMGSVFSHDKKEETGIIEKSSLCIAVCSSDSDYTKIKQLIDLLTKALDIDYEASSKEHSSFIIGRSAKIISSKEEFGIAGEIKPEVLENFSVPMPVAALEIDLQKLFKIVYS